jgi:hypothetical protein
MTQRLSYCTVSLFLRGLLPLGAFTPQQPMAANENDPVPSFPGVWS